jgi:hypothetical protein
MGNVSKQIAEQTVRELMETVIERIEDCCYIGVILTENGSDTIELFDSKKRGVICQVLNELSHDHYEAVVKTAAANN